MHRLQTYLIEDSAVIRENLIATLEEVLPLRMVGWAADEAAALAWLGAAARPPVELVILDLFLQGPGSGLGVLAALKRMAQPLEVVVLSNFASADMRQRCLALGAAAVFDKSHEIDGLIAYCACLAAHPRRLPGANQPPLAEPVC